MNRYIVTGHLGYIGSVLCKMLKERGDFVYGYDKRSREKMPEYVDMVFREDKPLYLPFGAAVDGIFYLGANSLLNQSISDPLPFFQNNVGGLLGDLQMLNSYQYDKPFVFASSAAVYGDPGKSIKIQEYNTKQPINPYGVTKLMGEQIIAEAARVGKFPYYACRFFNVAGAYGNVGQAPDQPHLLTSMLRTDAAGKEYTLFGDNIRDFIHVKDVCLALMAIMDYAKTTKETLKPSQFREKDMTSGGSMIFSPVKPYFGFGDFHREKNRAFNISTGIGTSMVDFAKAFLDVTNSPMIINKGDHRAGDPVYLYGDNEAMKDVFDWSPIYSSIGEIIDSAYRFFHA